MKNILLEKLGTRNIGYSYSDGTWSIYCHCGVFQINNNGIKLCNKREEGLNKLIFNLNDKTVECQVSNPTLPSHAPRKVDLSSAPDFFNGLLENIEEILADGHLQIISANAERTVFNISEQAAG